MGDQTIFYREISPPVRPPLFVARASAKARKFLVAASSLAFVRDISAFPGLGRRLLGRRHPHDAVNRPQIVLTNGLRSLCCGAMWRRVGRNGPHAPDRKLRAFSRRKAAAGLAEAASRAARNGRTVGADSWHGWFVVALPTTSFRGLGREAGGSIADRARRPGVQPPALFPVAQRRDRFAGADSAAGRDGKARGAGRGSDALGGW